MSKTLESMDALANSLRELQCKLGCAAPFRRDLAKPPRKNGGRIPVKPPYAEWDELARLSANKKRDPIEYPSIGHEMGLLLKKFHRQRNHLGELADIWQQFMPEKECGWCKLAAFVNGVLTVQVPSGGHLYEVRQVLQCGVEKQILDAAKATGLRRIVLKCGENLATDLHR